MVLQAFDAGWSFHRVTALAVPPAAVIFDFDDTLADSLPARLVALRRCLAEHRGREVSAEEATHVLASAPFIDEQLRRFVEDAAAIPRLVARYREHYYHPGRAPLPAFSGIPQTLAELSQRGIAVAMVTSRYRAGALDNAAWGVVHELERMGLASAFPTIVGFEDTAEHKPSAEPFLACCRQLGIPPQQVLAVGDTPFDITGARAAGAMSAAALWGTADREALLAAQPDVVFTQPQDILNHV